MLFNSLAFAAYFPIVTVLYFLFRHQYRWAFLLAASCVFYMFFVPRYIFILFFLIAIDYIAGILIEDSRAAMRKPMLVVSICANVAVLGFFKYCNFLNANTAALAKLLHWNYGISSLSIILPIGLSFHTFQSMSYTIEVYRGKQKAERHLGIYALYVLFYPQLVAGPIERPQNLLHQFREEHVFDTLRFKSGLKLMFAGLFKKIVIADTLASVVNQVYSDPTRYAGLPLVLATYLFAFQIYCDFSGYTDVARGAARIMGFDLMRNFDRPYFSKSISEFWRRWHISLSTWFRDYLYIPLGGSQVSTGRWYANLFIVFLVSGFWHGANWTFVIWGALHGFYLIFALWTENFRQSLAEASGIARYPALRKILRIAVTFNLVSFAWIFFRANSLKDASYIVTHLWGGFSLADLSAGTLVLSLVLIVALEFIYLLQHRMQILAVVSRKPVWVKWSIYYALGATLVAWTLLYGQQYKAQQFIYFQF